MSTNPARVRATQGFVVYAAGGRRRVGTDEIFDAGDPIVKTRAHLFTDADEPTTTRTSTSTKGVARPVATKAPAKKAAKATKAAKKS